MILSQRNTIIVAVPHNGTTNPPAIQFPVFVSAINTHRTVFGSGDMMAPGSFYPQTQQGSIVRDGYCVALRENHPVDSLICMYNDIANN